MVSGGMLLGTDSTLRSLGLVAVGGNMTPLTAPKAKCVWSLLLESIDLVAAPGEPNPSFAEKAKDFLS